MKKTQWKVIYVGPIVYAFGVTVATFASPAEAEAYAASHVDVQVIEAAV